MSEATRMVNKKIALDFRSLRYSRSKGDRSQSGRAPRAVGIRILVSQTSSGRPSSSYGPRLSLYLSFFIEPRRHDALGWY